MEIYSVLLLIALLASAVSLVTTIGPLRRRAVCFPAAILGVVAAAGALAIHVPFGHRPGSDQALPPLAFVGEHPTLIGVLIVAAVLGVVQTIGRRDHE